MNHAVLIYWSKADGAYIAEVPELPGCAADGETRQKALATVEVVITE
jgi:predicted RNase H-like HicB family nuclease